MKRIVRLTETDLKRIVRRVIKEADTIVDPCQAEVDALKELIEMPKLPAACMAADNESECLKEIIGSLGLGLSNLNEIREAVMDLYDCREENKGVSF